MGFGFSAGGGGQVGVLKPHVILGTNAAAEFARRTSVFGNYGFEIVLRGRRHGAPSQAEGALPEGPLGHAICCS